MIEVVKSGLYTTIQDVGRFGFQKYGMPVSGVLDKDAFRLANWLVGNAINEAVLEITLTGPVLRFHKEVVIGITGADMQPKIDGKLVEMNSAIKVSKNSMLSFGKLKNGCRTYLSVSGGFDVVHEMNSKATYDYAKLGGLNGQALAAGDSLLLGNVDASFEEKKVPVHLVQNSYSTMPVRVIEGPEFHLLSKAGKEVLFTCGFTVGSASNRMGVRLNEVVELDLGSEMISSGIVQGTVQLPSSGMPIVLLADAQTTGGYPRVLNVIKADLSILAQQKPGDKIRFRKISLEKAQAVYYNKETEFTKLALHIEHKKRDLY
ncbi:5-oxoprolinase subunit C family protein [Flavicella marina]|uniref:5-oxoprolinase subunit C family protein n=1 Tax=Flavicella marina TaxID=1475951 RepID=UPI001264051C|nr:biotin-dependent carboxyltransferase family protein [Flavicella marina]